MPLKYLTGYSRYSEQDIVLPYHTMAEWGDKDDRVYRNVKDNHEERKNAIFH